MKFKELLNEKYKTTAERAVSNIEVFEEGGNFKKEINDIIKNSIYGSVRIGITDSKKPKMYAWDAVMYHHEMIKYTKIDFDLGFTYDKKGNRLFIYGWDKIEFQSEVKNKKEILKKIKKYVPFKILIDADDMEIDVSRYV